MQNRLRINLKLKLYQFILIFIVAIIFQNHSTNSTIIKFTNSSQNPFAIKNINNNFILKNYDRTSTFSGKLKEIENNLIHSNRRQRFNRDTYNHQTLATTTTKGKKNVKLIQLNEIIKNAINFNANPCDNFYEYACGNTINSIMVRDITTSTTTGTIFNRADIKRTIENYLYVDDENNLSDVEIKAKEFYKSCKESRNVGLLKNTELYRNTGGWPILENNWNETSIFNTLLEFSKIGQNHFFQHKISLQNNKRVIEIFTTLSGRLDPNEFNRTTYELLQDIGINKRMKEILIEELLEFEQERDNIAEYKRRRSNIRLNIIEYSIDDFQVKFPQFNWSEFFKNIIGKSIRSNDILIVYDEIVFMKILDFIKNSNPVKVSNYFWSNYLKSTTTRDCVDLLKKYFNPVYMTILERPSYNKFDIIQLFSEIRKSFDSIRHEFPQKCHIESAADSQNSNVYLNRQLNFLLHGDVKLNTQYESLQVNQKNFYENLERCNTFLTTTQSRYKSKIIDFYNLFKNNLNLVIRNRDAIMSTNFGSIGINLASEMIKGENKTLSALLSCYNPNAFSITPTDTQDDNVANRKNNKKSMLYRNFYTNFPTCSDLDNLLKGEIRGEGLSESKPISESDENIIKQDFLINYFAEKQSFLGLKSWIQFVNKNNGQDSIRKLEYEVLDEFKNLTNEKLFFINAAKRKCNQVYENTGLYRMITGSNDRTQTGDRRQRQQMEIENITKNFINKYFRRFFKEFDVIFQCPSRDTLSC
ncbi:neprilysin-1 [Condylostylus longicornis]|uniref:neprilysin-1 n=1 Tax=Condylostylus longicornis TaxID=2530218 RepID=UPI00244E1B55|nr:neprilysin-1 [Condylostylus longicornis]